MELHFVHFSDPIPDKGPPDLQPLQARIQSSTSDTFTGFYVILLPGYQKNIENSIENGFTLKSNERSRQISKNGTFLKIFFLKDQSVSECFSVSI